jgi:hypothetical protein
MVNGSTISVTRHSLSSPIPNTPARVWHVTAWVVATGELLLPSRGSRDRGVSEAGNIRSNFECCLTLICWRLGGQRATNTRRLEPSRVQVKMIRSAGARPSRMRRSF